MQCTNCGRVNGDDAAFCAGCGTSLALACPSCATPHQPGDAFCAKCGTRLAAEPEDADLHRYVPAELLDKLHAAHQGRTMAGERRMVTMLFADVQGSTAAAEQLDPEEWAEIINGAFDRLIRPVYRYEGTLARLMGDGVLAFFGAPIAHEDDPERAIRAGLAMLDEIRPYAAEAHTRWGVEFDLRVGINTGLVVMGEVGSDLRVEYTAIGDAVNVAARMEQAAIPGTILISESTQRLVEGLFDLEAVEPMAVKGKKQPVAAFRVVAARQRPATTRGILGRDTPLVGRQVELAELLRVADEVRQGRGQIAAVIGDAGVGKSRLVAALRADLEARECVAAWSGTGDAGPGRVRWGEARCLSYNTAVAYTPFVDLFTRAFGLDTGGDPQVARERVAAAVDASGADDPGRVTAYLCALLGIDPGGAEAGIIAELPAPALQKRVFAAVVDYIRACAATAPALLVFEDLHWADPVSLALLEELLAATDRTTLGVVALLRPYRDDASWRFHETSQRSFAHRYTPIHLEPLDGDAARTLLHDLVDRDLPPAVEAAVLQRAEGNPFFVEEIVRGLLESGSLDTGATAIPESVSALLTSRIDRLDASSKLAVQLASVLGREFDFAELTALVGDPESTEAAVSDLLSRDLIVERSRMPEREYAFRHALIQETAYSTILLKERRTLHARVATHLEHRRFDPQEMARHLIESQQEVRAVPHLVAAGEQAARAMNLAEAVRLYDLALTWVADGDPIAVRAHEGLGAAYSLIPDLTRASASYQRMLDFGRERSEPSIQVTALNRLGSATAFLSGDIPRATGFLEEARKLAEQAGDEAGLAEYHMNSCMIATHLGDLEAAASHDEETARLGTSTGSERVRLGGLIQRAQSLIYATRFDEGRVALDHARRAAAGSSDPTVEANLAASELLLLLRDGQIADAWTAARRATELAAAVGLPAASVLNLYAGMVATTRGSLEDALAHYGEAARLGQELVQGFNAAAATASLARLYAQMDIEDDDVAALRTRATELLSWPMGTMLSSVVHAELGWAALERGDPEAAADHFDTGLAGSSAAKYLETPALLLGAAQARLETGDHEAAGDLLARASVFVEERAMAYLWPAVALVAGSIALAAGDASRAVDLLGDGAGLAEAMGEQDLLWRLHALRAGGLRRLGDDATADSAAADAREVVDRMATDFADAGMRDAFVAAAQARIAVLAAGPLSRA